MTKPVNFTKEEVAQTIEDFFNGTSWEWDWDEFCTFPIVAPELERIRVRCAQLHKEFPPEQPGQYCGPDGLRVLETYVRDLRQVSK